MGYSPYRGRLKFSQHLEAWACTTSGHIGKTEPVKEITCTDTLIYAMARFPLQHQPQPCQGMFFTSRLGC